MSTSQASRRPLKPRVHARFRTAGAWIVSLVMVLPLIWMVSVSLRLPGQALPRQLEWIPEPINWENYRTVFDIVPFARFALNSAIVVALAVPTTIIFSSLAGFAISQLSPSWRLRITAFSLVEMMIPVTAYWLTRFILFKEAGLLDSRWALIVPAFAGTSPIFVLIFLWTFRRIPAEVFEAARLDGASAFRTWSSIAMPLALPSIVAVGVLSFVYYWRQFVEPLLYIQTTARMTLPLGLKALQELDSTNWPILMAGCVLTTLPVVIVFLAVQRAFLQGNRGSGWLGR